MRFCDLKVTAGPALPTDLHSFASRSWRRTAVCAVILLTASVSGWAFAQSERANDKLIQDLNHIISWYHRVISVCQTVPTLSATPERDDIRAGAVKVLQLAFEYARSEAS